MRVLVVATPAPLLERDDAKRHLKVTGADEDALIDALIKAVSAHIDGPLTWLGRAIRTQTIEARCDGFCNGTELPGVTASSVTSVNYVDSTGSEQTLDPAAYVLRGPRLDLAYGASFPAARAEPESVRIRYVAGADTTPADIAHAARLMVGDLYAFRETAVTGVVAAEIPMSATVQALLAPHRKWSL